MNKKNKKYIFVIAGILVIGLSLFLYFNNKNKDNDIINEEVNNKKFAIMIEKSDGTGYEESNTFPFGYLFNYELSGCANTDGKLIDGALTYDNGVIDAILEETAYCYLYFDLDEIIPQAFTFYVGGEDNPTTIANAETTVYLSWDDTDITQYCVSNVENVNSCNWSEVSGTSHTASHTLESGDGEKIVYAYIKDASGNISEVVRDTITLDTTPPTSNSVLINSDNTYATTTSVTLTLASSDASEMCISNTTNCSNWEDYDTSKSWSLLSEDGTKTVYVWYRDEYGNTSEYVIDTIILDTTVPMNNSISINSGATHATSANVTLTLASTGATEMCISNTSTCSDWIDYATSKSWTLSSGDGSKIVYVWYRDAAGNVSTFVNDTINLDTTPPTNNSVSINSGATYTKSTSVTLTLASTDASEMCISNTSSCTSWEDYATSKSWTLNNSTNGTKTVYVWYRDSLGNTTSSTVSDTITLDTVAPTSNSVKINSNATYATSTSVTLTLASSGATEMCISNTTSCSSWVTYATSKSHTLTSGDGTKTVYVWFRDAAGNTTSTYVSDSITLDTQAPTSNSVKINSGASSTTSTSVTLTLSSSGATQMCISNTTSCSSWVTYATSKSHTLTSGDGTKTVYVWYRDAAGNVSSRVSDSITYSTLKCTSGNAIGSCLTQSTITGLSSTAVDGMYRYYGSSVNNYVSIGGVLYRIIGITSAANSTLGLEAGQLKVIKATSIGTYYWHSSSLTNTTWTSSSMYSYLQGSSVLGNTSIIPSGWSSKIDSVKWYIGDAHINSDTTTSAMITSQKSKTTSSTSKIALMYVTDYCLAVSNNLSDSCLYSSKNWMSTSSDEWTMTRMGYMSNYNDCMNSGDGDIDNDGWTDCDPNNYSGWYPYNAWDLVSGYMTYATSLNSKFAVRPVFYLLPSVTYKSGTGTSSNPFVLG